MVTVNVVVLAGRLSDMPEVKSMPSGDQVTRFRLHVPDPGKRVLPLPVFAWDKLARKGCERLTKGDAVLVRGHEQRPVVAGLPDTTLGQDCPDRLEPSEDSIPTLDWAAI